MSRATLVSGLAGAIGSDYRAAGNRLVFVEYGGKISQLDLTPSPGIFIGPTLPINILKEPPFRIDPGPLRKLVAGGKLKGVKALRRAALNPKLAQRFSAEVPPVPAVDAVDWSTIDVATLQDMVTAGGLADDADLVAAVQALSPEADLKASLDPDLLHRLAKLIWWWWYDAYTVLGTGYSELEDIVVAADETHAWVSERGGSIYHVDLNDADRTAPTTSVVVSGLQAPSQLAVDEATSTAYVVEFGAVGRLLRIDLTTGSTTTVADNLLGAVGLALDLPNGTAYVTEQARDGGSLTRVRLSDGRREQVAGGLGPVFFLTWLDATHSALLTPLRDPVHSVIRVDVGTGAVATIAAGVPFRPSSVAVTTTKLLICSDTVISSDDLTPYAASGPVLLGLGHVPADKIVGGLATTDPGYFFSATEAPFGGSLPVMVNHAGARSVGAAYYTVDVDGVPVTQPFNDYRWESVPGQFVLRSTTPANGRFYPVRAAGELWYNPYLGAFHDTTAGADGNHTITVRLWAAPTTGSEVGSAADPGRSVLVTVNNLWPRVRINGIAKNGIPVPVCGIVQLGTSGGSSGFTFDISADSVGGYLDTWALTALWGADRSAGIASDAYAAHAPGPWTGVSGIVPAGGWDCAVPGDPTSTNCAHTFVLGAWDRTIDGFSHLHYAQSTQSITILP